MRKLFGVVAAMAVLAGIGGFAALTTRSFPPAGNSTVYQASLTRQSYEGRLSRKAFVGPADDPFFVDLGATYDVAAGVLLTQGDDSHTVSADAVLVTVEPGGGSETPTTQPIASAAVPA